MTKNKTHAIVIKSNRKDFELNQAKIREAFIEILKEKKGRRPTRAELAERTGIHYNTIQKHLSGVDFSDLLADSQRIFKVLNDDVVLSIYRSALKGNPAAQKLWLQYVNGWSEKTETKLSGKVEVDNKPPVILKISRG